MRRFFRGAALYLFHLSFVRPVLRWGAGVRYRRRSLVPRGPCLVVSNHNSHLDAPVLMGLFPLRRLAKIHPVAAADYFGTTWLWRTLAMILMNGIPIERRPVAGSDPLAPLAEHLEAGHSLVFFPEGSRGEAGVVAQFRPGIGRLLRRVPGLLVVPVFLSGPERIWPRGQLVPVPLNIDAIVGKPRSYPADLEPREIAEQVQRDVLSLAPAPPPVPGSPPPPPVRVAVCGLDATTREVVFRKITERLGRNQSALGISRRVIEADADGVREITGPIPHVRARAWLGLLAWLFRTGGRFEGDRFVEMIERTRTDEALDRGSSARFVVTDGSGLVDMMAWAVAVLSGEAFEESGIHHVLQYLSARKKIPLGKWWRFIRRAPEIWLINVFDLARPPIPDVLVQVSPPISRMMEALRSGGEEPRADQNEESFKKLEEGYAEVGQVLGKRHKVRVFRFDPSETDVESIARRVEEACRDRADDAVPRDRNGVPS